MGLENHADYSWDAFQAARTRAFDQINTSRVLAQICRDFDGVATPDHETRIGYNGQGEGLDAARDHANPRGEVVRPLPECAPYRQCCGRVVGRSARGTTTNHQCKRRARFLRVYDGVAVAVCDRHLGGLA
jgi:hypothetical protein